MHTPQIDLLGREMKIGDHVVWAAYTRESGLQHGTITAFPTKTVKKQKYDPTTRTYSTTLIDETKIQVQTQGRRWENGGYVEYPVKRTLDTPARFAVVELPDGS